MDLISTYAVGVGEVDAEGQPPLDPADQIRLDRVRLEELSTVPERQHRAPDAASILDALRDNTSFENIVFGSRILVWESRDARPAHLVILASPWDREQHKWSASLVLGELKRRRQVRGPRPHRALWLRQPAHSVCLLPSDRYRAVWLQQSHSRFTATRCGGPFPDMSCAHVLHCVFPDVCGICM